MKTQVYSFGVSGFSRTRTRFAQWWHGKERRTMVYNVPMAIISFPHDEEVGRLKILCTEKKAF